MRNSQKRHRAEGRGEKRGHRRMFTLAKRSEWVCHCATGSKCVSQKLTQGKEVTWGWALWSPVQELRDEPPYATTIGRLWVFLGETIAPVLIPDWSRWATLLPEKMLNPQQLRDSRKWSGSVFLVLACVFCLVTSARLSGKVKEIACPWMPPSLDTELEVVQQGRYNHNFLGSQS